MEEVFGSSGGVGVFTDGSATDGSATVGAFTVGSVTVGAATVGAVLDVFPEEADVSVSSEEVEPVLEPALEPVFELVFESVFGVVVCGVGISLPLSS